jgi:hypothetical protein
MHCNPASLLPSVRKASLSQATRSSFEPCKSSSRSSFMCRHCRDFRCCSAVHRVFPSRSVVSCSRRGRIDVDSVKSTLAQLHASRFFIESVHRIFPYLFLSRTEYLTDLQHATGSSIRHRKGSTSSKSADAGYSLRGLIVSSSTTNERKCAIKSPGPFDFVS